MQAQPARAIDETKLQAILGKVVGDLGAAMSCSLALLGERLGLWRALAETPLTSEELAAKTGTTERYVREWLLHQAASGYVLYHPSTKKYELPHEHALVLADDRSPFSVLGGFQIVSALSRARERVEESFRTGSGMAWGEHDVDLFEGTQRFFRSAYLRSLVAQWLPSLDGVTDRLERGARVADVGCGFGASTILMAEAFPKSTFTGFDNHAPSVDAARASAIASGVDARTSFEVAKASDFPGDGYDLVCYFDCIHDMGEPALALERARKSLAPGGTIMIVEPMAGNSPEENHNPVGRVFSGASVLCCTPNAVATGNTWLGTCASDEDLRVVAHAAGLTRFRRAFEDPFNRVFEARP